MLPDLIAIPVTTAASFRVSGDLTARDQSWAIALLVQAIEIGETGDVLLPDNRTREALGLIRRDKITTEEARWARLRDGMICGLPVPCVPFAIAPDRTVYPIRHNLNDRLSIMIDEDLADMFDDGRTDDLVYLPVRILQHAECRYTLTMTMRVLAWAAGSVERRWIVREGGGRLKLRIPVGDLRDALSTPSGMRPATFMSDVIGVVCGEITQLTDYVVTAAARMAHTGRIRDVEIDIVVPDVQRMLDEMHAMGPAEHQARWRPKDRPVRRRAPEMPAPAIPVAVSKAALDAAAPLSVKRPPAIEKTARPSIFSHSPGSFFGPPSVGSRDTEIDF